MSDTAVVVAHHRLLCGVIDLACREAGVQVIGRADSAAGAVSACRTCHPDLLVLDLELPDADGLTALTELGSRRPRQVVVLADMAPGDIVLRALQLGASAYVTKGNGLADLASVIRRVGAGERVMSPMHEQDAIRALGGMARRAREGADVAASLTSRERQVLEMLSVGLTTGQVASRIGISPRTVETHVAKVYRKLGVRTRVHAVSRAAALGLVEL